MTTPNWSALAVHFREQAAFVEREAERRRALVAKGTGSPFTTMVTCAGCGVPVFGSMLCAPCNRAVSEAVAARGEEVRK